MIKTFTSFSLIFTLSAVILLTGCFNSKDSSNPGGVAVSGVTLNKTSTAILVGNTELLVATISPDDAGNKNVSWSSNLTGVATVSQGGLVTGVSAGTATITVTTEDGGKTAACTATVSTTSVGTWDSSKWDNADWGL
jgi:uncharacterized protein YjdB